LGTNGFQSDMLIALVTLRGGGGGGAVEDAAGVEPAGSGDGLF